MKAIVQDTYGSPEVLRLADIDRPTPGDTEVLIRIQAASLNAYDWHMLRGKPYLVRMMSGLRRPKLLVPGVDMAGRVEAVGCAVTRFKPGDEVFGPSRGALAEYTAAGEQNFALKPGGVGFEEAAATPMAGATALQALRDKGAIETGQRVLINGASGGVGTFAVQIAKAFGAEVTAVCSTTHVDTARSIGADHVIDYTQQDFATGDRRYDLIVYVGGNRSLSAGRRVLEPNGRIVVVGGELGGNWVGPLVGMLKPYIASFMRRQKVIGMLARSNAEDLEFIAGLMEEGKVRPVIDRRYPLSEVPEAMRHMGEGHAGGKVIITI